MRAAFVVFCAALTGACVTPPVELDSDPVVAMSWQAAVPSVDGGPVSASAIAQPLGGRSGTRVTVSLSGSTNGALHAWHIHQGSCGEDSPLVGPASAYTPIPTGGSGQAQIITVLPVTLDPRGVYFIHIYQAARYAASGSLRVAACGAFTLTPR